MSVEISGVIKLEFKKYDDHTSIWMDLTTSDAKLSCTIWIPAHIFIKEMRSMLDEFERSVSDTKTFRYTVEAPKDAPLPEVEATRL